MPFTDVMVDTETTGLDPVRNNLLQIAAVKFDFKTGEIGPVFDRCLAPAPGRYWDESTRTWWGSQRKDILSGIIQRMEDPGGVMLALRDFILADGPLKTPIRMWAKPVHFDFPFISSYFGQFGLANPINFRFTRDLNTYMAARAGGADHQKMEHIDVPDGAHNALVDCVYQLKLLFAARDGDFGIQDAEWEEIENAG